MVNKNKYKDKCAFIHKNCDDEQVGLINYLEFYYCKFSPAAKFVPLAVLALWLCTLFTVSIEYPFPRYGLWLWLLITFLGGY